jgi:hypothetical protein
MAHVRPEISNRPHILEMTSCKDNALVRGLCEDGDQKSRPGLEGHQCTGSVVKSKLPAAFSGLFAKKELKFSQNVFATIFLVDETIFHPMTFCHIWSTGRGRIEGGQQPGHELASYLLPEDGESWKEYWVFSSLSTTTVSVLTTPDRERKYAKNSYRSSTES